MTGSWQWRAHTLHRLFAVVTFAAALALPAGAAAALRQDAACKISGVIATDTRWDPAACRTYSVTGNVQVSDGVTLTIAAGSTVQFAPGTVLQVQGTLVARGTEAAPIRFTSGRAEPQPGDWTGLELLGTGASFDPTGHYAGGTVLEYCEVRHGGGGSEGGVVIREVSPYIAHSIIEDNAGNGVIRRQNFGGSGPPLLRIEHNRIRRNGANGVAVLGGSVTLQDNEISENGSRGLYVSSATILGLEVVGNVVRFNGGGGLSLTFGFDGLIRDNVITDNIVQTESDAGIAVTSPYLEGMVITNNDIHDNRAPDGRRFDLRNASPRGLNAALNWWGTTDRTRIAEHIVDFGDDRALGAVNFEPFLSAPNGHALPVPRLFLPLLVLLR